MSGTSVDGIDCALVQCTDTGATLVATHQQPIPADTRIRIADISLPGDNEIDRMGALDRELGELFAAAALELLHRSGTARNQIAAIGSHGQTIRHRPPSATGDPMASFSLQIGDPNTIAELTGITTVADFRRRDLAAGGEAAPLAPAFHAAMFSAGGVNRVVVNVGGIANVSLLEGKLLRQGFDTGPGNTLLDQWTYRHRGEAFDRDGCWAAQGKVLSGLLDTLQAHPFLQLTGPRSTGKEAFNLAWLDDRLVTWDTAAPVDVQATLCEFTATTIARGVLEAPLPVAEIYICGGGAHNRYLMDRLAALLAPRPLATTNRLGIDPDWVEAAAFAWLASRTLAGMPGNCAAVTGAAGERILGGIYPA